MPVQKKTLRILVKSIRLAGSSSLGELNRSDRSKIPYGPEGAPLTRRMTVTKHVITVYNVPLRGAVYLKFQECFKFKRGEHRRSCELQPGITYKNSCKTKETTSVDPLKALKLLPIQIQSQLSPKNGLPDVSGSIALRANSRASNTDQPKRV